MFPCSLCRLCAISLPLPCFLARISSFQHIREEPGKRNTVSVAEGRNQNQVKSVRVKRLKWKRCYSCPQLHPHKDVLMLGGFSQCALQSLVASLWNQKQTHTGCKSLIDTLKNNNHKKDPKSTINPRINSKKLRGINQSARKASPL